MFSVCSPENKFLGGCFGKMYFSAFGVYWSVNGGTPSDGRSFGINTLAGLYRQVFEE
jgi:hypothetical protein